MLVLLSKSFASSAMGFAVAEGRLSVTDPVKPRRGSSRHP
jgi:CubicO group peptidase (beta-lactamase class C family)